jgi:glycosidase
MQHEWFKASKSGRENEYRDWYMWKKGKIDENGKRHPPNNWAAMWGGKYIVSFFKS